MPEEQTIKPDLERILDNLEDYTLTTHSYQAIQNALDAEDNIRKPVFEKLLAICVREMRTDKRFAANILNIILTILKKLKKAQFTSLPDLVPSVLGLLHILKTAALFKQVGSLKALCFETIMSYPDETMIKLVENESNELLEFFDSYCSQRESLELRLQVLNIISKLLKILPPDKKRTFVFNGRSIWFSRIIPCITISSALPHVLDTLELMIEELVHIDYSDNPHWKVISECICNPQKYPAHMKDLLKKLNVNWHRLWIIFIKLLKRQITDNSGNIGINPMLSVVEMAFKMDSANRCKAFLCWKVLIDNFSTETNETYINKKVKLLIIPLTLNNAKDEETVLVKLNTWWHLIYCFFSHMDKFSGIILIPFLHFCFGKPVSDKPARTPGMISDATKAQCVKAFINIIDNSNFLVCEDLPKLNGKILSTKLLVNHWADWFHCLSNALRICSENKDFTNEEITCLWKSFLSCLGLFPENNIRRDLFNEVLSLLAKLTENCNNRMTDIILNILIRTLVDDAETKPLMVSKDQQNAPIHKIIDILLKLPNNHLNNIQIINQIKPITNFLVENAFNTSNHSIDYILNLMKSNSLLLWVVLADTVCEKSLTLCPKTLYKIVSWPFGYMDLFVNETLATKSWLNLYKFVYSSINKINNDDMFRIIMKHNGSLLSNKFILKAVIAAVQQKIAFDDGNFGKEPKWLLTSVRKFNQYRDIEEIYPSLSEVVVQIMNNLIRNNNEAVANNVVLIVVHMLKMIEENMSVDHSIHLELIFKSLKSFFKIDAYSKLKSLLLNEIKSLDNYFINKQSLNDIISEINFKDAKVIEANTGLKENEKQNNDININQPYETAFTTPNEKPIAKQKKKKEEKLNIVKTVVENGEEFVVIKSNWKFNPKTLTDAQKEKFQRKRGDIPALYQDLSQSQDDFKLNAWKTDSQDTTASSKTTSGVGNEDVTNILKNLPHADIVPKILENIISEDKLNDVKSIAPKENIQIETENVNNKQQIVKDTKSPRLALKDRVFRNVRNLMEKSNVTSENSNNDNMPNTPKMIKVVPSTSLTNSAPTICVERPSRVKRKPRKYADSELFGLNKRRRSLGQSDYQVDSDITGDSSLDSNIVVEQHEITNDIVNQNNKKQNDIRNEGIINIPKEISIPDTNEICEVSSSVEQSKNDVILDDIMEVTDNNNLKTSTKTENCLNTGETQIEELNSTDKKISVNTFVDNSVENDSTPETGKNKLTNEQKFSSKKSTSRKSRIEKELAIDMVEGHPFLNISQPLKRATRKTILSTPSSRRNLAEKLNKNKLNTRETPSLESVEKRKKSEEDNSIILKSTHNCTEDILESQDVIESSQESTVTTISVTSHKLGNKVPIVALEIIETQNLNLILDDPNETKSNSKDDIELPCNKTMEDDVLNLTENIEPEPSKTVVITDKEDGNIVILNEEEKSIQDVQCTAEADTQPVDTKVFDEIQNNHVEVIDITESNPTDENSLENFVNIVTKESSVPALTQNDVTQTMTESLLADKELDSPFKDEEQRKKDFLNNTQEISPIKNLSPLREKKSPSPETSSDYVVIKLSSPVQGSNGEPFEKSESPEVFTEENSPDKLNQSPPRGEKSVNNTSPKSFSLKRNRPQVRSNGRGAQMLGLCVTDVRISDSDEKKSPSLNTSARRNLKMFNSSEINEAEDNEDNDNFLKLKRTLPTNDCSPSGPILKRKLVDITDEATVSPASKRKRVSFHDPPVSTTICVKKYIEPCGVRSPQNSTLKRQERQLRSQLPIKSPRRLENVFKLDSVLTKAVESFTDNITPSNDTDELTEVTPTVEVVKTSDLNDTDPICPDLIHCTDSISNIASELSSPAMKVLLVNVLENKVKTVSDLAKMTELEVNRLCIKAPKVQTARKVLNEYLNKIRKATQETIDITECKSVEVQTHVLMESREMQTDALAISATHAQTDSPLTINCSAQTDEGGLPSCSSERTELMEKLFDQLDETSKREIGEKLFNRVINEQSKLISTNKDMFLFCQKLHKELCDRFFTEA